MKEQKNTVEPSAVSVSDKTDQNSADEKNLEQQDTPLKTDNGTEPDKRTSVAENKSHGRLTRRQRNEKRAEQRRCAVVQNVQLRAFRRGLSRWAVFYLLMTVLIAEAAVTFGVMILELNLTSSNLFVEILDFIVTFRLVPMLCQFALYGVVAYAVVKLGTQDAHFPIAMLFVQSLLLFVVRAGEELIAGAAVYDIAVNFDLLPQFGSYMIRNAGYWILGLIAFMIPAFVLVFLCIYLAQEYKGTKNRAFPQNQAGKKENRKKNPMPTICFWTAVTQTLLAVAEILPQSIATFWNNGRFFADIKELFSYFIPYIVLILVGAAGYFMMLGVTKQFRHLLQRIRRRYPLAEETVPSSSVKEE